MDDKMFDELIKDKLKNYNSVPKQIDQLFSDFEMKLNMKPFEEKRKHFKLINFLKTTAIAASSVLVLFIGGCTYAHVNGNETILSPLLRSLGINSKYEENSTHFNEEVAKQNVTIKLLDGALDDTSLIIGYEINIENNDPDNWLEINGEYKINNINIKPINFIIDKLSDNKYIYYQVFDASELHLNNTENIKIESTVFEIKEYTEYETIDSANIEYNHIFNDEWKFDEIIDLKNLINSKKYEFTNSKSYEIIKNVHLSVNEFIEGSYTNILKIETDLTNYTGNSFEKYYKILDDKNVEIATFFEEEKTYDNKVYNDRLISEKISKNSKIYIEVYLKTIDEDYFSKVVTIPVDLSRATEISEVTSNLKEYSTNNYKFKYKENWILTPELTSEKVGPNSIYLGALELEIPSTTNSEYSSSIYVKTTNTSINLEEYKNQIKLQNSQSLSEYFEETSESDVDFKNRKGYQITSQTTDGEDVYVKKDFFTILNGILYQLTFFGSEKEYNNLVPEINEFVNNFECI